MIGTDHRLHCRSANARPRRCVELSAMSRAQTELVFDGEGGFVTAVLRPAKRPSGKEIKPLLRRLLGAIRAHWPNTEILARGPTATIAVPRFSIGVAPMASITSSASRQPLRRHCRRSRSQHEGEIRGRAARCQASSFRGVLRTARKAGAGSSTRTQPSRARTRQSAALSGIACFRQTGSRRGWRRSSRRSRLQE